MESINGGRFAKIIEDLKSMYSGIIADACDSILGVGSRRHMHHRIRPIDRDTKVVGPAMTILQRPARRGTGLKDTFAATDVAPPGSVVVVAGQILDAGMWGEMLSLRGLYRGVGGAIVDGGVRDVEIIRKRGFPLFYHVPSVNTAQTRVDTVAVNVAVECGEVVVEPEDLIFGDFDGVIVVPHFVIEKVHDLCLSMFEREIKMRNALDEGEDLTRLDKALGIL